MPKSIKFFRSREKARRYRNRQRDLNYVKGAIHQRGKGRRWNDVEKQFVILSSSSDREIARKLRRSVRAVQMMRFRIKNNAKRTINRMFHRPERSL